MRIEHVAIWVKNIELMKHFYQHYFQAQANNKYQNTAKRFSSYFLTFESGARLELMQMNSVIESVNDIHQQYTGFSHIAFNLGSREDVDDLTIRFKQAGVQILNGPRQTGDGYYETLLLDPEGNRIEITA